MKKFLGFVLAAVMLLAMAVPALANTTSVEAEGSNSIDAYGVIANAGETIDVSLNWGVDGVMTFTYTTGKYNSTTGETYNEWDDYCSIGVTNYSPIALAFAFDFTAESTWDGDLSFELFDVNSYGFDSWSNNTLTLKKASDGKLGDISQRYETYGSIIVTVTDSSEGIEETNTKLGTVTVTITKA